MNLDAIMKKLSKLHYRVLRYFYDFILSFEYFGFIYGWFSKFYIKLIPKVDKLFILDVKAKIAFDREREHDIEFFRKQRKRYKLLSNKIESIVINTNNSKKECIKKILIEILGENN